MLIAGTGPALALLNAGTGPALALLNAGTGRYSLDAGAPTLLYISTDFRAPHPPRNLE